MIVGWHDLTGLYEGQDACGGGGKFGERKETGNESETRHFEASTLIRFFARLEHYLLETYRSVGDKGCAFLKYQIG